ncbi:unnamed protein product [Notodromas monacha]|uniref:Ig-like domain-containing protein n=1 Tax=Notodromas monacha TaxID=399045 RepID=A0A7R9GAQ1_9CRUS|nr:unnamed protein product [Notodromas monacha]CAG0915669.1 unnamed protein product [Notodromas monacha]
MQGIPCIRALLKYCPPRISDVVEPIVANAGETLKLPCPVDGEPYPMFEWFKDGESLIMADDRIRATKNGLRIKEAEVDDSGIYECKAVNGFGQVSIEVELWINVRHHVHVLSLCACVP